MLTRLAQLILILVILNAANSRTFAQDAPLTGPLLAYTDAAQDVIYLYDVATGATRRLTVPGAGWINVWDFSPDGCRLLYTRTDGIYGFAQLYSATLAGADVQDLVTYDELPGSQWGVWEPDWSPTGDRIALTLLRDGYDGAPERQYHVAWVPAGGGPPTPYSVTGREFSPQWSPDGAWLAYVSYDPRAAGADAASTAVPTPEGSTPAPLVLVNEADLWIVSADAATKYRQTAYSVGSVERPRWSPDGTQISFTYSPAPGNNTHWVVTPGEANRPVQLVYTWNLTLDTTWLPDSSALLSAVRDFGGVSENRLWVIPLDGSADARASEYLADSRPYPHADYPRFSADGRHLAFRTAYALAVIATESQAEVALIDAPGNTPPVWSPAGFSGEATCR
jgi:Tol biopolymer transport system component